MACILSTHVLFGVASYGQSVKVLWPNYRGWGYAFKGFYLSYFAVLGVLSLLMVVLPTSLGAYPRFYFLDAIICILGPMLCGPVGEAVSTYLVNYDDKKAQEGKEGKAEKIDAGEYGGNGNGKGGGGGGGQINMKPISPSPFVLHHRRRGLDLEIRKARQKDQPEGQEASQGREQTEEEKGD